MKEKSPMKKPEISDRRLNVRLPNSMLSKLQKIAIQNGISSGFLAKKAISDFIAGKLEIKIKI